MPLEPGDCAPSVSALNQHGTEITPSFDDPTVVYFYPADDTPGCTTEATEFETERETYREAGMTVYGVSVDDVASHESFAEQHDIAFDLLADPDGEVASAFDVERRASGVTERTTFVVIDERIDSVYTGVDPAGHARQVLRDLLDEGTVEFNW